MNHSSKKTIWGWIVAIIIVVIAIIGFAKDSPGSNPNNGQKQEVVIGVSLPLTGDLSFLGETYKKGIDLAMSEIASTSSQLKNNYRVVYQDDAFIPGRGATSVRKLIDTDHASAIFTFGSPVGNAVGPIAEEARIPHLNSIASDPKVAVGDWNFVHWTPPYKETEVFVGELKKRNISKIILLEQNQPGVKAVAESLRKDLAGSGIEIVAQDRFEGTTKDFRTIISKIKPMKSDLVVLEATSPALEVLARQLREQGINTPWTSIETFEFTDDPALFEGAWYVNAADQNDEFVNKYVARYGEYPKLGAGNGYDSVKIVVEAAEKFGTKPEQIRQGIAGLKNWNGAMGSNLYVDTDGIVVSNAVVRMIKDGKPVTVK